MSHATCADPTFVLPVHITGCLRVGRCAGVLLLCGFLLAQWMLLAGCGGESPPPMPRAPGDWHAFEGTWTAAGTRHTLQLASGEWAAIATYEGSLMLSGPARPNIGFRAQALVFTDSATGMTGRAVWTDEHGDRVFSELAAAAGSGASRVAGRITGGTGRYDGADGTYEFAWRFLLADEDGTVQGQSQGLRGRVRIGAPRGAPP